MPASVYVDLTFSIKIDAEHHGREPVGIYFSIYAKWTKKCLLFPSTFLRVNDSLPSLVGRINGSGRYYCFVARGAMYLIFKTSARKCRRTH